LRRSSSAGAGSCPWSLSSRRRPAFPPWLVAVADLYDSAPLYLYTDEAYRDHGGYEQTMAFVDPSELLLKQKMEELITGRPTAA
jgi:hypothetical protein